MSETPVIPHAPRDHRGQWKTKRGLNDAPLRAHVVFPDGRIKQVAYAHNISTWMLDVDKENVRLSSRAIKRGYWMLEDLYAAENNRAGWDAYLDWWKAREEGRLPVARPDGNGGIVQPSPVFPERLLPKAVVEQRKTAPTRNQWSPPDNGEAA